MRPPFSSANHSNSSGSKNSTDEDDDDVQITGNRRRRGRPTGAKNKPKPPVIVTRESPMGLRSNVLEIASGADILDAVASLAKIRQRGISVLSAIGKVSNVALRNAGNADGSFASFLGEFEILCVQGVFLPPPSPVEASGMTAFLAGPHGEIVGGRVVGELIASGTVTVIAASFANAAFERLPLSAVEEEEAAAEEPQKGEEKSVVLDL